MCAPLIPSWSFPSTVLKEMNTLPWLPRIFIGNWAAACYSCSWFYPAADPISGDWIRVVADYILRLTRSPAASYNLRLSRVPAVDSSYDWVELWQLDTRYVWFHPTTDSSSSGWKRVAADSIPWLTRVPATGYELQLTLSYGWLEFRQLDTTYSWADSSCGWLRVVADSILRLTRVPATGLEMWLTYTLIYQVDLRTYCTKYIFFFFLFFFVIYHWIQLALIQALATASRTLKQLEEAWESLKKLQDSKCKWF